MGAGASPQGGSQELRLRAVARADDRAADVTDYGPTRRWASPAGALIDCKGGVRAEASDQPDGAHAFLCGWIDDLEQDRVPRLWLLDAGQGSRGLRLTGVTAYAGPAN